MARVKMADVEPMSLVGSVLKGVELDGKAEDLPLQIGSFKVVGSKKNRSGSFLIGFDDEMLKLKIPVGSIISFDRGRY